MKLMRQLLIMVVFLSLVLTACNRADQKKRSNTAVADTTTIDAESLYQTNGKWDNQYGDTISLSKLSGKIPVISMVFTRCTYSCPRTVKDMQAIEKLIPDNKKDKVIFVMVSFDSDRDHTKELQTFTQKLKLGKNWLILHGDDDSVRELSMLLDMKYKKQPNGDFTHSSGITLLDTRGAIAAQVDRLGADPNIFISKIKTL